MESGVLPGFFSLLAWIIFLGATGCAIALGAILSFNWSRYAMNPSATMAASAVYAVGCLVILALLLGAVIATR